MMRTAGFVCAGACLLALGLPSRGAVPDICVVSDTASARRDWHPQFGSLPVETVLDDAGSRVLVLPADFGGEQSRACWDWQGDMDLSQAGRVSFEVCAEGGDLVGTAAVYFGTPGGGWYAGFWGGISSSWRRQTFRLDTFGTEGVPAGWDKVTACRISFWSNGPGKATFKIRAFAAEDADPGENFLLNGSFETPGIGIPPCWGSGHWGLGNMPWAADPALWRRHWGLDPTVARDGNSSLRIINTPGLPLLRANSVWFSIPRTTGAVTASAWLRADVDSLPVTFSCGEQSTQVTVGREWMQAVLPGVSGQPRLTLVVAPEAPGTLWLDAVQVQALPQATAAFHEALGDAALAEQTQAVDWSPTPRTPAVARGRVPVVPVVPAKTSIDQHGRFLLNGVPYLQHSFGLEFVDDLAVLDAVVGMGFRDICIMFHAGDTTERLVEIFDHCARIGLYVIPWMDGGIPRERFADHIRALKGHPALLCWYVYDEPSGERFAEANARLALARELDPECPAFINYLSDKLEGHLGDIYSTDVYPIPGSGPLTAIRAVTRMKAAADKENKPVWMWLQGTGYAYSMAREPSQRELACMVYGSLIEGARGIYYFAQTPRSQPCLEEMQALVVELEALTPALTSLDPSPPVGNDGDGLLLAAFATGPEVTILAVHTQNSHVEATLSVAGAEGPVDVRFEGRRVPAADGAWKDHFGPYERHVYRFRR